MGGPVTSCWWTVRLRWHETCLTERSGINFTPQTLSLLGCNPNLRQKRFFISIRKDRLFCLDLLLPSCDRTVTSPGCTVYKTGKPYWSWHEKPRKCRSGGRVYVVVQRGATQLIKGDKTQLELNHHTFGGSNTAATTTSCVYVETW